MTMHVVMVAGECVPFAKVGGLGDVIGALPLALEKLGVRVTVVIPRHSVIDLNKLGFEPRPAPGNGKVPVAFESIPYDVHHGKLPKSNVDVFLLGNDRFFNRPGIYVDPATNRDYVDQSDRWIFFQRAVMEFFKSSVPAPDILHCHDHQTGLIPAYLRRFYRTDYSYPQTRTVFTIHNMGYQGLFPRDVMTRAGFHDAEFYPLSPFEFYGAMNFMKVGITFADLVSTVSPTYAREIQESREFAYGLEGVLKERSDRLIGILNGIDDRLWDPSTDNLIAATYSLDDISPKIENKKALLQRFGIDQSHLEWPLLAMISRIDVQKGFDLVASVLEDFLAQRLHFVLLGSGNKDTEAELRWIIEQHPGKAGMRFEFDNGSAHITEAGADIFLMPSKYEPCGLNQMYSLRYGTVPVVRHTGGLADTVREFDKSTGEGTGFVFHDYDAEQFKFAIERALDLWWTDKDAWHRLMLNGMRTDSGWENSAQKYLEAYEAVRKM